MEKQFSVVQNEVNTINTAHINILYTLGHHPDVLYHEDRLPWIPNESQCIGADSDFCTKEMNVTNLKNHLEFTGVTTVCRTKTPVLYRAKTKSKEDALLLEAAWILWDGSVRKIPKRS